MLGCLHCRRRWWRRPGRPAPATVARPASSCARAAASPRPSPSSAAHHATPAIDAAHGVVQGPVYTGPGRLHACLPLFPITVAVPDETVHAVVRDAAVPKPPPSVPTTFPRVGAASTP